MNTTRRNFLATAAVAGLASTVHASDKPGKTPNTKFAINIEMWFRSLPFLKRIEATAAMGFPAFEYWDFRSKDKSPEAIAELCQKLGIIPVQFTAWGFKPGLNDPKNHGAFVDTIGVACEVAKKIGAPMMTVVGGDDIPGVSQEKMHEAIIEGLKKAAPIAQKNNIMIILEPMNIRVDHKGHCLYGSAPAMKIIQAVESSHVKINWDLYHMHITEGDLCGHLREGFKANAIGYVQIADHPGRNEPGTGEIHYPRVLKELKSLGYTGYVGVECRPKTSEAEAAAAVLRADTW